MSNKDISEKFSKAPDKAMFLEGFFRYDLSGMVTMSGYRADALRVIFSNFATHLRDAERKDPEQFTFIFKELLSRFERAGKYRAPNGTRTVTKAEAEDICQSLANMQQDTKSK